MIDPSSKNNYQKDNLYKNNFDDSKRDDLFYDEDMIKAKGINKAIDVLLANDDLE